MKWIKDIEVMLQSYHRILSYYAIGINDNSEKFNEHEFEKEITDFTCRWDVPKRLAEIRRILSEKFDDTLGKDDMGDLERVMEGIKYWTKPGDTP